MNRSRTTSPDALVAEPRQADLDQLRLARIARRAHDDRMLQLTPAELNRKRKIQRRRKGKAAKQARKAQR